MTRLLASGAIVCHLGFDVFGSGAGHQSDRGGSARVHVGHEINMLLDNGTDFTACDWDSFYHSSEKSLYIKLDFLVIRV